MKVIKFIFPIKREILCFDITSFFRIILAWCFDLLLFYRSIEDDPQARKVLAELETYAKFSFVVNGLVTCLLAIFGLIGNALFVAQLHAKSNHFSRRLANHLTALCAWDIALLCCCIGSYGIICMCVGILPFVGITAYLLYLFQPFASFCVTGTIWQVLAITVERYKAVSKPLEQRTRKGQFSLKTICLSIVCGAFALNFLAVPFERALVDCYEFRTDGFAVRTMIVQQDLVNSQYYAILSHLVPDLIFRAPTPIIIIAILTVRTLQMASAQRTIGHQQIIPQRQRALGRNVHLMLTLLSVKFVLCNTLYLFNTILMEIMGYGGKTSSQQTELEMEQYIRSLYLTDFSNMLLAIHSATNWLIFYKWPKCKEEKKKRFAASFTLSASSTDLTKNVPIEPQWAVIILNRFREIRDEICTSILYSLCSNSTSIAKALGLNSEMPINQQFFSNNNTQRRYCVLLGDIIEAIIFPLTKTNYDNDTDEWRDFCRQIGYYYNNVNAYLNADQWKLVRTKLVIALTRTPHSGYSIANNNYASKCLEQPKQAILSHLQKSLIRCFNCALREMKNGALCALVDAKMTSNGYKTLGALAAGPHFGTPIRLIKRLSWISGPPAGVVARSIFPCPSSSRDSFSLVFQSNETEQSCIQQKEDGEEIKRGNNVESTAPLIENMMNDP